MVVRNTQHVYNHYNNYVCLLQQLLITIATLLIDLTTVEYESCKATLISIANTLLYLLQTLLITCSKTLARVKAHIVLTLQNTCAFITKHVYMHYKTLL